MAACFGIVWHWGFYSIFQASIPLVNISFELMGCLFYYQSMHMWNIQDHNCSWSIMSRTWKLKYEIILGELMLAEDALKITYYALYTHSVSVPFKIRLFLKHKNATGRCRGWNSCSARGHMGCVSAWRCSPSSDLVILSPHVATPLILNSPPRGRQH